MMSGAKLGLSGVSCVVHHPIMIKIPFMLALVAILAGMGCATGPRTAPNYVPPSAASSASADLVIISATYGSGTNFSDVTDRVNDLIHQPNVEFFARPEWLHADPTPGWNKALVIVYEFKGRRHIFTTGEGGRVCVDLLIQQTDK
jgi:hypothetical protein